MLVITHDATLGDSISCLPALEALRQRHPDLQMLFRNEAVAALLPKNLRERCTWDIPNGQHETLTLGAWNAVKQFGRNEHATQILMRAAGIEPPKDIPRPKIVFDDKAPAYDYVIAPFTADPKERGWDMQHWAELVLLLAQDSRSIAVIGGRDAAELPTVGFDWQPSYHFDRPLSFIASLMKNARKAVITLDSGPSRLAHAVGCKRHLLLCSNVVPQVWAMNPYGHTLYGAPGSWTVQQVLNAVKRIAAQQE